MTSATAADLTIDELPVNYTGARRTAIAINVPPDPPQDQLPHQSYEQMVEMMRMDDTERYGRVIVDQLEAGIPAAAVTIKREGAEPITFSSDERGLAISPPMLPDLSMMSIMARLGVSFFFSERMRTGRALSMEVR